MFANLGRTLSLLRELRGKSQSRVAREARIGKSQLSKYENGKELPKLDSLEKILRVLKVDMFEFFYTLYLVDGRAAALARAAVEAVALGGAAAGDPSAAAERLSSMPAAGMEAEPRDAVVDRAAAGGAAAAAGFPGGGSPAEAAPGPLYLPPLPHDHPLLAEATDQAFARVFSDLLVLYRRVFEQVVLSGPSRTENLKV
ncbi:MAG TPA: helix-turn-helix transcriptional regulator [Thermoanaerobaculia bacterium]|nr:helix-turn-helix transcriptional regulator [Thermoanaerobaculia bacterium]